MKEILISLAVVVVLTVAVSASVILHASDGLHVFLLLLDMVAVIIAIANILSSQQQQ